MSDHGKVLVHRCWCGLETVRSTRVGPERERAFAECVCGEPIDWSKAPLEDHASYVVDLISRISRGEY